MKMNRGMGDKVTKNKREMVLLKGQLFEICTLVLDWLDKGSVIGWLYILQLYFSYTILKHKLHTDPKLKFIFNLKIRLYLSYKKNNRHGPLFLINFLI